MGSVDRGDDLVRLPALRVRPRRRPGRGRYARSGTTTARAPMTAGIVSGRQPAQLEELEAQRLEVCDVAVQRGPVGDRTHQQGVDAGLERF